MGESRDLRATLKQMALPLLLLASLLATRYEYVYESYDETNSLFSIMKPASTSLVVVTAVINYQAAAPLDSAAVALQFQSLAIASGFDASTVVPIDAPASGTVHTAHTVHAPPSPHPVPNTPHQGSAHNMGMPAEAMGMAGTVHEAMAPASMDMDMAADDMDMAVVHQPSPHDDMAMLKAQYSMTLVLTVVGSCDTNFGSLSSASSVATLSTNLGTLVNSITINTGQSCLVCSDVPDVSNSCPATRNVDFCVQVANTLTCLDRGSPVAADPTPDTDPTCAYDLNTPAGIASYFTAICSPATV
eukprot:c9149_g1_i1.p1 GENE.c9149_g1_i1~~c9149_g1_i1.p1  ORF type:complete len:302 (+),score=60.60 c9149_g1_i1:3-908(+)